MGVSFRGRKATTDPKVTEFFCPGYF